MQPTDPSSPDSGQPLPEGTGSFQRPGSLAMGSGGDGRGPRNRTNTDSRGGWLRRLVPWLIGLAALGGLGLAFGARYLVDEAPTLELSLDGRVAILPFHVDAARTDAWAAWGLAALVTETLEASEPVPVVPLRRLHGLFDERKLALGDAAGRSRARELAAAVGARVIVDATYRRDGEKVALDIRFLDPAGRETAVHRVVGDDALDAAGILAYSIADTLGKGAAPVPLERAFSRDPFVDRLYAEGVHEWMISKPGERARWSQPFFEIALRHEPTFVQAKARLADCLRVRGQLPEARALAEELLQEAQSLGSRAVQAEAFRDLGLIAALEGDVVAAREQYRQAQRLEEGRGDGAGQAEALFEQARLALAQNDSEQAEALLTEVSTLRQGLGDRLGRIDASLRIGSSMLAEGRFDEAGQILEEARRAAVELRDPWEEHRALASLGEVAWRRGDLDVAAEAWRQALVFYRQQEDRPRLLLLSHNLARALRLLGRMEEAEALYQDQLEMAQEAGNRRLEADAYLRLAWLSLRQGYPFQARPHLDAALALDRHLDDRDDLRRVIAWLAYEQGNFDLAIRTLSQLERQSTTVWTATDAAFLEVYRQAKAEGRRLPVPGEENYIGG